MKSAAAETTISKVKHTFAAQGFPEQVISDNVLQFITSNFATLVEYSTIGSNREVKRFVATSKNSIY